ncbi:hypothetical protein BDP27DRAFT_1374055 [Rhodocollybia butyracea]|uniref:Uncharacterized protein n=1 Tax=Rhodocollybia butyracea TaxID=206335 RepID=A0A9P5P3C3_9AGAR|nr:hypothetical protein BDP27DRAFT_1374055 [Rhodocollybia butyracea]
MLQVVFNRSNRGLKSQLKKYLLPGLRDAVDTLAERIVQGCPVTGNEGKTLWPTNTKDKFKYGVRIDWGGQLSQATDGKWYRDLNLQINASAEQKSIQELGQKMGTDYKYSHPKANANWIRRPV